MNSSLHHPATGAPVESKFQTRPITFGSDLCVAAFSHLRAVPTCWRRTSVLLGLLAILALLSGCATNWQTAGLMAGVTAAGARSPSTEMEQIYYLGVFDPEGQLPPAIYRVTVHGQASFISLAKFASGWVPAEVADSLTSTIDYNDQNTLTVSKSTNSPVTLQTGRRLVLFGPEGFREAPRDSRLVIVMGTNPSKYFEGVTQVMSKISLGSQAAQNNAVVNQILATLVRANNDKDNLQGILDALPASTKSQP